MLLIAPKNIMNNDMDDNMNMTKKIFPSRLTCRQCICAVFMVMTFTASAHAELTPLENADMEAVCGSAGIMLAVKDVQIFHHIETIRYSAPGDSSYPSTDPRSSCNGYIEFQNFMMGGNGDVAKFNFNYDFGTPPPAPYYYFGTYTNDLPPSGLIFFDVAEPEVAPVNDWSNTAIYPGDEIFRGMTLLRVPYWDQELSYYIDNIRFSDPDYPNYTDPINAPWVDLGSLKIGLIDMPRFYTYTSPSIGGNGFDFQHNFQMTIDKIGYSYNTDCDAIELCTTYIGGSFKGTGGGDAYVDSSGATIVDDPRNPTTWKPNNKNTDFGEFQIGDLFGDMSDPDPTARYSNPAGIDVGETDPDCTETTNGPLPVLGFVNLRLPMEGSIRFESATWYTDRATNTFTDFGPGAIDGIQVHRLDLQLIP